MSLQFIFGGSGKGKSYYLQHFISKEAKLFPERQYLVRRAGAVYDADTKRIDRDQR